jgi:sodium transport system permease protein
MYPAIEMFTNEKERGTLETILSTPVSRMKILFGKMSVVAIAGLLSALLSIAGLSIGMQRMSASVPDELFGTLSIYSDPSTILLLVLMLVPLVIFIAGIMTLITCYARSYKEAQSLISPLMMIIIIPAVLGMMPFLELNTGSALIPITNIALAAKEIIAGTLDYGHFSLVIISLFVYATLGVMASTFWFGREKSILRI